MVRPPYWLLSSRARNPLVAGISYNQAGQAAGPSHQIGPHRLRVKSSGKQGGHDGRRLPLSLDLGAPSPDAEGLGRDEPPGAAADLVPRRPAGADADSWRPRHGWQPRPLPDQGPPAHA